MEKRLGYIGLGKMGLNMVMRLRECGYDIVVSDQNAEAMDKGVAAGARRADSIAKLTEALIAPRVVWVMVPHAAVDSVVEALAQHLSPGDIVIDGGNSYYRDSIRRGDMLSAKEISFIDAGISGGPVGARDGACVMVGGVDATVQKCEGLFRDVAAQDAYAHVGTRGAGHFVKMVHNGIEYGMMQAIAEGFSVLKAAEFELDLKRVANLYNHQSVITSRLVGWLKNAYEVYGQDLEDISDVVEQTGEGMWTRGAAQQLGVPTPVLEAAIKFREESAQVDRYADRILSALRNQFGGHSASSTQS